MSGDRPSRTKKPRSAEASGAKWHLQRGVRRDASNGETRRCKNGFGAQALGTSSTHQHFYAQDECNFEAVRGLRRALF
jgi:hypothetical protein